MRALFLDFARAFDTMWHRGLIYKLVVAGINPEILETTWFYLRRRSFGVRVGEVLSFSKFIFAGVPQGA